MFLKNVNFLLYAEVMYNRHTMKRINITITNEQYKKIQEYERCTEMGMSELIRRLIDEFFKNQTEEKKGGDKAGEVS